MKSTKTEYEKYLKRIRLRISEIEDSLERLPVLKQSMEISYEDWKKEQEDRNKPFTL